ncbi:hypothetical protein I5677_12240 [Mobilitalea sibirica]|uniref:Uncharacterized protein n=1 Tax=Mobilitalea sibirica TaxID=1462919 RepID=A0A8J7L325_9FIRM|nr:hypothetical protein [Mobilitalea sibirica]MBH1941663.1 hypothetical protein [Mobilitalea sibirica]
MRAEHKRLTREDKLARKYYCQRASRGLIKGQKRYNHRKLRRISKGAVKE